MLADAFVRAGIFGIARRSRSACGHGLPRFSARSACRAAVANSLSVISAGLAVVHLPGQQVRIEPGVQRRAPR